jgi:hypothetical protein
VIDRELVERLATAEKKKLIGNHDEATPEALAQMIGGITPEAVRYVLDESGPVVMAGIHLGILIQREVSFTLSLDEVRIVGYHLREVEEMGRLKPAELELLDRVTREEIDG